MIGDFIKILQYNNIDVELIKDDNCCGMPKLELGDLYTVEKMMHKNLKILLKYVEKGFKIIAPIPSCVLMFKQELPLLFPENTDLVKISKSFYDPFEFLYKLNNENKLNVNFKNELGKVFYHVSCHQRVQNIGLLTKKVLELIPNTNVEEIERCSGHDGTYGVKKETFEIAMKIVKPIKKAYEQSSHKIYTSDCSLAAHHIENSLNNKVSPTHPISLLRTAYGI